MPPTGSNSRAGVTILLTMQTGGMTMAEQIAATRDELAAAFDAWTEEYEAHPNRFGATTASYGTACADYLIDKVDAMRQPAPPAV